MLTVTLNSPLTHTHRIVLMRSQSPLYLGHEETVQSVSSTVCEAFTPTQCFYSHLILSQMVNL